MFVFGVCLMLLGGLVSFVVPSVIVVIYQYNYVTFYSNHFLFGYFYFLMLPLVSFVGFLCFLCFYLSEI